MNKLSLSICAAACAGACHGEPLYYHFAYQGFDQSSDIMPERFWDPDARLAGSFRGEDMDGDNVIGLSEMTSFTLDGRQYDYCTGYDRCHVSSFSYAIGGALLLAASYQHYIPNTYSWGRSYQTLHDAYPIISTYTDYDINSYDWRTPATRFTIVSSVPEPASWLALAAGLGIVGGAALRRGRAAG